ncbi:hypothetical protein SteCoe_18206 [Stentor coeruleus]|uniref:Importin subunit alpha n=1 Tax=Stentor coeruleus TaxID=5963 RepID=A0A1R2BX24_9CILI|nr:hypothetical protein SteCoe_18206 [Stentor coeruleus]
MEENQRAKSFTSSFNLEKAKHDKGQSEVQLRQKKRESLTQKRRNLDTNSTWISLKDHYPENYSPEDLPSILSCFLNPDDTSHLYIAHAVRILLCRKDDCPLEEICNSEVMNQLNFWLNRNDHPQLQYEAAWICTNISSSSKCNLLYEIKALESLVNLLYSPSEEVRHQVAWALGNVGANSSDERDYLLSIKVIDALGFCLKNCIKEKNISSIVWTLTNICRKKPLTDISEIRQVFPMILPYLKTNNVGIITDILRTVALYSTYQEIQLAFTTDEGIDILKHLFSITESKTLTMLTLKIMGGLCFSRDGVTQAFLDKGMALDIKTALYSKYNKVKKEAIWALGNLCAETHKELYYIIKEGILEIIIKYAQYESPSIRSECVWVLCNSSVVCNLEQALYLIQLGLIEALISMLKEQIESNIILQGLSNLIDKCLKNTQTIDENNILIKALENCGGIEAIEKCTKNKNEKISERAMRILETIEKQECEENLDYLMGSITTSMAF